MNKQQEELYWAVANVKTEQVQRLLQDPFFDDDANLNFTYTGRSPLIMSIEKASLRIVELLIAKGADMNFLNPLHTAIGKSLTVAELLILKGANINSTNALKESPLYMTASRGLFNLSELLISKGANLNVYETGKNPLRIAVEKGHIKIVDLLILNGADVNAENGSILSSAIKKGSIGIVELLISKGIDMNGKYGSMLSYALEVGNIEIVELLISKGADLALAIEHDESILHKSAKNGFLEITEKILSKGFDVNKRSSDGYTPLHEAAQGGFYNIAELLVLKGADVNSKTKRSDDFSDGSYTPLHLAMRGRNHQLVELLISKGADVNARTSKGHTPLHLISQNGAETKVINDNGDLPHQEKFEREDLLEIESILKRAANSSSLIITNYSSGSPKFDKLVDMYFKIYNNCVEYNVSSEERGGTSKHTSGIYYHDFKSALISIDKLGAFKNQVAYNILHLISMVKDITVSVGWTCDLADMGELSYSEVRKKARSVLNKYGNPSYDATAFRNKKAYLPNTNVLYRILKLFHLY